jgi:hypothetical protein
MLAQDIGPMVYEIREMTVREFIQNLLPETDCLPVHQRIDVFNYGREDRKKRFPTKRQGIVGSIFKGIDISEMKINERTPVERRKFAEKYESIDGGNRKRAIQDFVNNKFCTNAFYNADIGAKFFRELSDEEKERFYNFKIRFVVYKHLTPVQKSNIWETTNNSTPVNHQEMLNGRGDIAIANIIRQNARQDRRLGTFNHVLFDQKDSTDGKLIGEWLSFDSTRLTYDRLVARVAVMVWQGEKPGYCDDAQIERMYNDVGFTEENIKPFEKKVKQCIDFIFSIAQEKRRATARSAKLTNDEFIMLMRLYFTYKNRYGSFTIKDKSEWYDCFREAFRGLQKKDPSDWGLEMIPTYEKHSKEMKMRAALFIDNLSKGDVRRWNDTVEWMEEYYLTPQELIDRGVLIVRDTKRTISKKDRENLLAKQRGRCYIDGKKLMLDDAEAGHIVPHSDGGSTSLDNMVMVRRSHNSRMGSMNLETYKKMYLEEKVAA